MKSPPINGFWLPQKIHEQLITPKTNYVISSFASGKACDQATPGAVTAHWPVLSHQDWKQCLELLDEGRQLAPRGEDYWKRLESAVQGVEKRFQNPQDPLHIHAMETIPGYTGYSESMIRMTLNALNLMNLDQMLDAYAGSPAQRSSSDWQSMDGLPGRLIFNRSGSIANISSWLSGSGRRLFDDIEVPILVLGYGAGNVPGTALLIAMLAQSTTMAGQGQTPPSVIVRNSRREPIFTPLVLSAIESLDPVLVAGIATLIWDYEDRELQGFLLGKCDLVIAAASDETIASIADQITTTNAARSSSPIRFHEHGHKVSFSVISRQVTQKTGLEGVGGQPVIDIVALLAGLDSIFWDQYGCLSSRIHFVEDTGGDHYSAVEYAGKLTNNLRQLAVYLPRGASPRRQLKDSFDRYKLLERRSQVSVASAYEDDFLVAVDRRQLDPMNFLSAVNACMGRVIIVRPIEDPMEFPDHYLRMLPPENLQSLSVVFGEYTDRTDTGFLKFAKACARRGVTAIRSVGRGAFPQLAYSWDGLIPLDLVAERPRGYFTTIEFDDPYQEMLDTYRLFLKQAGRLGLLE